MKIFFSTTGFRSHIAQQNCLKTSSVKTVTFIFVSSDTPQYPPPLSDKWVLHVRRCGCRKLQRRRTNVVDDARAAKKRQQTDPPSHGKSTWRGCVTLTSHKPPTRLIDNKRGTVMESAIKFWGRNNWINALRKIQPMWVLFSLLSKLTFSRDILRLEKLRKHGEKANTKRLRRLWLWLRCSMCVWDRRKMKKKNHQTFKMQTVSRKERH